MGVNQFSDLLFNFMTYIIIMYVHHYLAYVCTYCTRVCIFKCEYGYISNRFQ